jgi:hypothetical protein
LLPRFLLVALALKEPVKLESESVVLFKAGEEDDCDASKDVVLEYRRRDDLRYGLKFIILI